MKLIFVGGVGGSGTRVIANILKDNGIYIGTNLNDSLDNLDWPGNNELLKDTHITFDEKCKRLKEPFESFIHKMIQDHSLSNCSNRDTLAIKVPGSFYYMPFLLKIFKNSCYIHLIRNGLDMAFSSNKNQLKNWGKMFNLASNTNNQESQQLKYWIRSNQHALNIHKQFPDSFHLIKFEKICSHTKSEIDRLFEYLGLENNTSQLTLDSIQRPKTFERFRQHNLNSFDQEDLDSLKDFGY